MDCAANREPLTPLAVLERSLATFPDRAAVIYGPVTWSYRRFGEEISRLAGALARAGIEPDDRVALVAPNVPTLLVAHFAVLQIQASLVVINPQLSSEVIAGIVNHCGAKIVFVDPEFAPLFLDAALEHQPVLVNLEDPIAGVLGRPLDGPTYDEFVQDAPLLPLDNSIDDEERLASITYTSGTTGLPKGVMVTHRAAYFSAVGQILLHELDFSSVFLWTVPLAHANGWCLSWAVSGIGATHVMLREARPEEVVRLIVAEAVTHLCGSPAMLMKMADALTASGRRFDPVIRVATFGSPLPPKLLTRMEELGVHLSHIYGSTETLGPVVHCQPQSGWQDLAIDERSQLLSRQGVPAPISTRLRVVDTSMQEVPKDGRTLGEIVMRGNRIMKGYFKNPVATRAAFEGGWFHSGDLAVMHPDGYMEVHDRMSDAILCNGEYISSFAIERVIWCHDEVLECAVIGVPHPSLGQCPRAFVLLREGARVSGSELIDLCREQLDEVTCPDAIVFGPLPRTPTGKVQKYRLREWSKST